jgi:predicted Zn-ribbon and HTH transcriptional regulator
MSLLYMRPTLRHVCILHAMDEPLRSSTICALHEQQELELVLEDVEPSEAADLRRKRRREVGKGWKCDKCGK